MTIGQNLTQDQAIASGNLASFSRIGESALSYPANGRAYLDSLANRYIVKPKGAAGIGGFVFDVEDETSASIFVEATDHYTEKNEAIQDHAVVKPFRLRLRGFVGELVFKKPTGVLGALDLLQDKLGVVDAYLGKRTPGAVTKLRAITTRAESTVNKIDNALARTKNIVGFFDKSVHGLTAQKHAFQKLQGLAVTKQLVTVDSPFGTHNNMMVESAIFIQPRDTKSIADIVVTMKQMRFATTSLLTYEKNLNRRTQKAAPATGGNITPGKITSVQGDLAPYLFVPK